MCGSMVDIQSATAEIRRGKKEYRRQKEETTGQKYNVRRAATMNSDVEFSTKYATKYN